MLGLSLTSLAIGTGSPSTIRSWGGWNVSAGWAESPANTFTRNTANSWTPRIYSNTAFTGPCKVEGTYISGSNVAIGIDTNRTVTLVYQSRYQWYFAPTAQSYLAGAARTANGIPLAGDIYGIRKTGTTGNWTVEWYRIRSGVTTVLDTLTTATDEMLGVLAGAYENTASFSLALPAG